MRNFQVAGRPNLLLRDASHRRLVNRLTMIRTADQL